MKEERPRIWNLLLCIPGDIVQRTLREAGEPSAACAPYVLSDHDYMIDIDDWLQVTNRVRQQQQRERLAVGGWRRLAGTEGLLEGDDDGGRR